MLRLIIVDDEKAIRESIHASIDWGKLGISVIGLCKNGAEAYDMVLDEYPDIVLTDIKMPGLSGLELIARITQAMLNIEFVILSGFGEFEFAKEAMRWGVKHYLLKPSTEAQIVEVMQSVKEDCYRKRINSDIQKKQRQLSVVMRQGMVRNTLTEALSGNAPLAAVIEQRNQFIDFENTNYELCYFYYLEENNLTSCLRALLEYQQLHAPGIPLHAAYVKYALIVFFEGYALSYQDFDAFAANITLPAQQTPIQFERASYHNLLALLTVLVEKLQRFETVALMDGMHRISLCNYSSLLKKMESLTVTLKTSEGPARQAALKELSNLLSTIVDLDFLTVLVTSVLIKHSVLLSDIITPVQVTEFLTAIRECVNAEKLRAIIMARFDSLFEKTPAVIREHKDCVARIIQYVDDNIGNPELSLKWLAENQLYMNVDYLSKQFAKQTGERFSSFLTHKRIEKATSLLMTCSNDKIYMVAEAVGCGNNPQYFSQIFKRAVGMTPSEFIKHNQPA